MNLIERGFVPRSEGAAEVPVLLMHDGQNAFDQDAPHGGWDAGAAVDSLPMAVVVLAIDSVADRFGAYSHVEDRIGVKLDTTGLFHQRGNICLVGLFHRLPGGAEFGIIGQRFEFFELIQVRHPVWADILGDQLRQCRVAGFEPAPLCYPVGFIVEPCGIKRVKIGE